MISYTAKVTNTAPRPVLIPSMAAASKIMELGDYFFLED